MKIIAVIFLSIFLTLAFLIGAMFIPYLSANLYLTSLFWIIHALLISIVIIGPFLSRMSSNVEESGLIKLTSLASYQLMGFYFILLTFLIIKIPLQFILKFDSSDFIYSIGALIISILLTIIGFWFAKKSPCIIKVEVPIKDLPTELEDFKIVQMSDIHVSSSIKREFVEKIVSVANFENPDLIALTGDLVDGKYEQLKNDVEPFKNLKAKWGVFYCPGNHEYYWGVEKWIEVFSSLKMNVLLNQHKKIDIKGKMLMVAGVHDLASHRINEKFKCDPNSALNSKEVFDVKILLAHQPKTVRLIKNEKVDLVLAGHTHAGQFFPANLLIFLFQPYVKGLHKVHSTWLYINQGTGYWGPPNRFGTISEITVLTLKKAK